MTAPLTPSQTTGPYMAIGLPWPDGPFVVAEGTPGAITITGVVWDGAGVPVSDALVETWQADPGRRATLVAAAQPGPPRAPGGPGVLRFDIRLQGDHETVFLDV